MTTLRPTGNSSVRSGIARAVTPASSPALAVPSPSPRGPPCLVRYPLPRSLLAGPAAEPRWVPRMSHHTDKVASLRGGLPAESHFSTFKTPRTNGKSIFLNCFFRYIASLTQNNYIAPEISSNYSKNFSLKWIQIFYVTMELCSIILFSLDMLSSNAHSLHTGPHRSLEPLSLPSFCLARQLRVAAA